MGKKCNFQSQFAQFGIFLPEVPTQSQATYLCKNIGGAAPHPHPSKFTPITIGNLSMEEILAHMTLLLHGTFANAGKATKTSVAQIAWQKKQESLVEVCKLSLSLIFLYSGMLS